MARHQHYSQYRAKVSIGFNAVKSRFSRTIFFLAISMSLAPHALAEIVSFAGPDGLTLKGEWYPVKAAQPAPAVLLLHGCGGAWAKDGKPNARHAAMAAFLNEQGYAALLLDSFTPRGLREICTVKFAERSIKASDRAADAFAALAWLSQQADIDANKIGLLGWSHGGSTTLRTMQSPAHANTKGHFAAAVAFYPGCTRFSKAPYQPTAPLLILIGESDDWTPAETCRTLAAQARPLSPALSVHTYPATFHDFDNPALKTSKLREEVPNGVHPGKGVTIAPNPAAATDAWHRAVVWFANGFTQTHLDIYGDAAR